MAEHAAPGRFIPSPKARRYVYGVLASLGPVTLFYGVMSAQEVVLWLGTAQTVLGLGPALALANTPGGPSNG